jgi:membrane-associated phospholipid phosphatase
MPDNDPKSESPLLGIARAAGAPELLLGSLTLYGAGRVLSHGGLADVGYHSAEAIVISGVVTQMLKGLIGRERPYVADGLPGRFAFGRGFAERSYASFPSGHTTASFAVASVLTSEVTRRARGPAWRRWVVGSLAYGGAALVGTSRIYDDAHWVSDVVAGAGVGTLTGLILTRRSHSPAHKRGRLERWALGRAR